VLEFLASVLVGVAAAFAWMALWAVALRSFGLPVLMRTPSAVPIMGDAEVTADFVLRDISKSSDNTHRICGLGTGTFDSRWAAGEMAHL
jgi:hypothetical protein